MPEASIAIAPAGRAFSPLGASLGEFRSWGGEPDGLFPSQCLGRERVAMWPWGLAVLGPDDVCVRFEAGPAARLSLSGLAVMEVPLREAVRQLRGLDPSLVAWASGCASPESGLMLIAGARGGRLARADRALVAPRGSVEIEVQRIRPLSRRLVGCPWRHLGRAFRDLFAALRYGRLPKSWLRVIDGQMDAGRWADALESLLWAIDECGTTPNPDEKSFLCNMAARLRVRDVPARFEAWTRQRSDSRGSHDVR